MKILILGLAFDQLRQGVYTTDVKKFENSEQNLLEALQIPVLVDRRVDNSACENLLCLMRQKED